MDACDSGFVTDARIPKHRHHHPTFSLALGQPLAAPRTSDTTSCTRIQTGAISHVAPRTGYGSRRLLRHALPSTPVDGRSGALLAIGLVRPSLGSAKGDGWPDAPTARRVICYHPVVHRLRLAIGLFLRGLGWRLGTTVVLLVTATLAVAIAVIAPAFLGSAKDALVQDALRAATPQQSGLIIDAPAGLRRSALFATLARQPRLDGRALFANPIATADLSISLPPLKAAGHSAAPPMSIEGQLLERTDVCAHVIMLHGSCPTPGSPAIAVSERDATLLHLTIGSRVRFAAGMIAPGVLGAAPTVTTAVVGIYAPPEVLGPYWWGTQYFDFGAAGSVIQLDPFLVATGYFHNLPIPGPAVPIHEVPVGSRRPALTYLQAITFFGPSSPYALYRELQVPLVAQGRLNDANAVPTAAALEAYVTHALRSPLPSGAGPLSTGLIAILEGAASHQHSFSTVTAVDVVEMVLIGELVLASVIAGAMTTRATELRLGQLRGLGTWRLVRRSTFEPLVALLAAIPIGSEVGLGVVRLAAHRYFPAGIGVPLTREVLAVAGGTALTGLATTVVLAIEALRRNALEPSRTQQRRRALVRAALDVGLLTIAATSTVELFTSLHSAHGIAPLAALAPGALALGIAVAMAWGLAVLARIAALLTRSISPTALYVAARELRSQGSFLRRTLMLAIAIGLVAFSVALNGVASNQANLAALLSTGAFESADLSLPPTLTLQKAISRADPSGHEALGAQLIRSSEGSLLAIQASRAASVLQWPDRLLGTPPLGRLIPRLDPASEGAFPVVGHRVSMTFELSPGPHWSSADAAFILPASVEITIETPSPEGPISVVSPIAALQQPTTITTALPVTCGVANTCFLTRVGFSSSGGQGIVFAPGSLRLVLLGTSDVGASPDGTPTQARAWIASFPGTTRATGVSWPLGYTGFYSAGPITLTATPRALRDTVPAIVARPPSGTAEGEPSPTAVVGLDESTLQAGPIASVTALPILGPSGALVDLRLAEQHLQSADLATNVVLLGPDDPGAVLARLSRMGVGITHIRTAGSLRTALRARPTAYAQDLLTPAAVAAALLVVAGVVFDAINDGRRRLAELAALRVLGMRRSQLVTTISLEHALVIVAGTTAGVAAGLLAAHEVLPGILPSPTALVAGLSLPFALPTIAIVRAAVLIAVAAVVASVVVSVRTVLRATFELLRAGDR